VSRFPELRVILLAATDYIYAVIVDELGLLGGAAVVLIYTLIAERGFKTAILAEDGFSKLLATGRTAIFALQAFVIIGGVTRVIPLTGVTLPFISYGGSSIIANFVSCPAAADLRTCRRRCAREGESGRRRREHPDRQALPASSSSLRALFGFTSYWSVFDADSLGG
jgi:cell division protein FtsW (lipid II flippase)